MTANNANDSTDEHLALTFSQHVVRLHGLLEQAIAPALGTQSLTPAELDVLATLHSAGSPYQLRPKDLAASLLLTTGGLSNVLSRLDARGLISRTADPTDGRSRNARLTPTGVTTAEAATAGAKKALQHALSPVPTMTLEDTLRQLKSILGAIGDIPSPASRQHPR